MLQTFNLNSENWKTSKNKVFKDCQPSCQEAKIPTNNIQSIFFRKLNYIPTNTNSKSIRQIVPNKIELKLCYSRENRFLFSN